AAPPALSADRLTARRLMLAALVIATMAGLMTLATLALAPGGHDALDLALLACFALTLPWAAIGFWNAVVGFLIMRGARDPVAAVFPAAVGVAPDMPITASVAILLCIRNEPPDRALRNLGPLLT